MNPNVAARNALYTHKKANQSTMTWASITPPAKQQQKQSHRTKKNKIKKQNRIKENNSGIQYP